MSVSVPKNISVDWRSLEQEDRSANRKIQIKNIQREMQEMAPQWKEAQQKIYGNMLDITPDIPLGQVLLKEGLSFGNSENNRELALQDLTKISDATIAEYIVDRLSVEEITYLVVNFKGILTKIKKTKTRLDKDIFINMIRQLAAETPVDLKDNTDDLSQMGEARRTTTKEASKRSAKQQKDENTSFLQAINQKEKRQIKQKNRDESQMNATVEIGDMFNSADRVLRQEAMLQKIRAAAREKKKAAEDLILSARHDAAQTTAGPFSSAVISPTTPSITRLSPRNSPAVISRNSNPTVFTAPRVSGRSRIPRIPYDPATGKGIMYGRGHNLREKSKINRHYLGKFYVEKHRLKDNILSVKYASTDAHIPTCKVQNISNEVKSIIEDVMHDRYNERLFQQLNANDKRVFKRFVRGIKLDIPINDEAEKEFQKEYQILKGEFQSGNDSPEIKKALKKYILEGLAENRINKNECHFLLYQLSL